MLLNFSLFNTSWGIKILLEILVEDMRNGMLDSNYI